ncbi:MAG: hypothetical protein MJZ19_06235 [Paludibacteraceae bacterium]|nr:hypothetical protein [Paludibacteraceae bacterium]
MVKLKQLFLSALLLPTLAQAKLPYISGSNNAGVALCKDGNVYSWGSDTTALGNTGVLNLDKTAPDFVEQSFYSKPQLVATGDVKFKKVVAGSGAMFYGVTESGELYRWGVPNEETIPFSQVMKDGKPLVDVKAVASDTNGFTALMNDGHAVYSYWTTNEHKEKIEVIKDVVLESGELLENIVEVSASDFGFYYVTADGSAYGNGTWNGNNSTSYMELTDYVLPVLDADKNPLKNVKFVEGGNVMAFALMQDGSLYSWGNGGWCQCTGQGVSKTTKNAERVVAGEYSTISGNVYLTNVMQVSAGRAFTLCVTTDGHALYWGCNEGNGGSAPFEGERAGYTPVLLKYADGTVVEDAVAVSTGDNFGFLINKKGEVYSFGLNNSGQCGVGSDKEEVKSLVKMDLPCELPEYVNVSFNADKLRLCDGDAISSFISATSNSGYRIMWTHDGTILDETGDVCPYYGDGLYGVMVTTDFGFSASDVVYVEAVKPAVEVNAVKNTLVKGRESECVLGFEVSVPDKSDVYFYSDAECTTLVDSMLGVEGKVELGVPYDKVDVTDGEATIWAVSKKSTVMNVEDVPQLNKIISGSNYFGSFGLIFEVDEPTTIKSFSVFAKGNQNLVESYIKLSPELYSTTVSSLGGYTYNKVLFKGEDQKFVLDLDYRECVVDCDVTLQPGVYIMSADLSGANYEYVNVRTNRIFLHSTTSYGSPVKDAVIGGVQFIGGVGLSKTPTAVPSDNVPFFNMKFERVLESQCGAVPVTSEIEYDIPQSLDAVSSEATDSTVDVYSTSGVLLRKSVERASATNGLPMGVYIVGGEKVVKTQGK